jgi:hypothetical protein
MGRRYRPKRAQSRDANKPVSTRVNAERCRKLRHGPTSDSRHYRIFSSACPFLQNIKFIKYLATYLRARGAFPFRTPALRRPQAAAEHFSNATLAEKLSAVDNDLVASSGTSCWRRSSTPRVDLACSSRPRPRRPLSERCHKSPPHRIVETGWLSRATPWLASRRQRPPGLRRAASARDHQRLARAREWGAISPAAVRNTGDQESTPGLSRRRGRSPHSPSSIHRPSTPAPASSCCCRRRGPAPLHQING